MPADSADVTDPKSTARSRVTNGSHVLPGVDGRSVWARRFRDLMELHHNDLGGEDRISEAQRSIVRRVATLEVALERLELSFALADAEKPVDGPMLDLYQRTSNTMRRHLESLGIEQRQSEKPMGIIDYAAKINGPATAGLMANMPHSNKRSA